MYNQGVDTQSYHQRLQAQKAEWSALGRENRRKLAESARARSVQRWQDKDGRAGQEDRAARFEIYVGGRDETESDDGLAGA